ncbi:MAG: thioredoxin family protein [Chitinophagaceae bacterium]
MLKYGWILFIVPLVGLSQSNETYNSDTEGKGILFEQLGSWNEVLAKAKAEGKYIFVDCYTTWCAPCKRMDKEVFPLEPVGDAYNKQFIAVKVQMDRTSRDNDRVKQWYNDADSIKSKFLVDAFPTYLFFSPDGKPVHRAAGAFSQGQFISLASAALDPARQSYTLEAKYEEEKKFTVSKMNDAELKHLAVFYKNSNPELANKMATEFISRLNTASMKENYAFVGQFSNHPAVYKLVTKYIDHLTSVDMLQLYTRENLGTTVQFMNSSRERTFQFMLQEATHVDSVMNVSYDYKVQNSYLWINKVIQKEEVTPFSEKAGVNPDWSKLYDLIKRKFNEPYATMSVHLAKIAWFSDKQDWSNYVKEIVAFMTQVDTSLQNSWHLNQYAWEVFQYSENRDELLKALSWSERAIMHAPTANWMDTYANILYKLGKKTIAIKWEETASALEPANKEFQSNLQKMNKEEPTW